jgi:hypothetical protein
MLLFYVRVQCILSRYYDNHLIGFFSEAKMSVVSKIPREYGYVVPASKDRHYHEYHSESDRMVCDTSVITIIKQLLSGADP